jgi:integrase
MHIAVAERRLRMGVNRRRKKEILDEFISYKNSLGYSYVTHEAYLRRYMVYEESQNPDGLMSKICVTEYLSSLSGSPGSLYGTVNVLREFSKYLSAHGYQDVYMIPPKTVKLPTPAPPYFFNSEEVERFFTAVDSIKPHPNYKGRELIVPAIFRLLYCCGIRCKEARDLKSSNVCLDNKYIDILQSKGPKSRRIFIGNELAEYLSAYDCKIAILYPERKYFFPAYHKDKQLGSCSIIGNFHHFWDKAFPGFSAETYPRAYDFRHHLAWANINKWATNGLDVNAMLPYLMRYMGHQSVKQTLYYFHFVPEFFQTYSEIAQISDDIIPEVPL